MPDTVTNELLYEVLKSIQERMDRHENVLKEVQSGQIRIREDLNGGRGDALRLERHPADVETRLERMERRLNVSVL